jgi:hypothetical protein
VYHRNAYLRIILDSSLLRQGRGGRILARAFARFLMEDSYDVKVAFAPSLDFVVESTDFTCPFVYGTVART